MEEENPNIFSKSDFRTSGRSIANSNKNKSPHASVNMSTLAVKNSPCKKIFKRSELS